MGRTKQIVAEVLMLDPALQHLAGLRDFSFLVLT